MRYYAGFSQIGSQILHGGPNNSICIVQVPIYILLLTITCLHNKAAVVTKNACKSICLGVQLQHSRGIDNYADYTLTLSDIINCVM